MQTMVATGTRVAQQQAPYDAGAPSIGERIKGLAALIEELERTALARECGPESAARAAEGNVKAAVESLARRISEWSEAEANSGVAVAHKNAKRNSVLEARNELVRRLVAWRTAETNRVKRTVINGFIAYLDETASDG